MDRLSSLLPHLRSQIVGLLPMKEATKLAILSTQWKHVSASFRKLVFHKICVYKNSEGKISFNENDQIAFRDCIDRTISSHDETDIRCFDLEVFCDGEVVREQDLNKWIMEAVQHNVRMLHLCALTKRKPISLPSSLFACASVINLRLSKIKLTGIPSFVRLPLLRNLEFRFVNFGENAQSTVNGFLSATNLPVLEWLEFHICQGVDSLSLSFPRLKLFRFKMENFPGFKLSISTLEKLHFAFEGLPQDISTIDIGAEMFSSLKKATFKMQMPKQTPDPFSSCHDSSKLMGGLDSLETINLKGSFVQFLSWDQAFLSHSQAISNCVKHLDLGFFSAKKSHVQMVKFLTGRFPQIQTLKICAEEVPEDMKKWQETELSIGDDILMMRHLKKVVIGNFHATKNEKDILRYLFATATILEEMRIYFSADTDDDIEKEVQQYLMSLPKVSQQVKLVWGKECCYHHQ